MTTKVDNRSVQRLTIHYVDVDVDVVLDLDSNTGKVIRVFIWLLIVGY